MQGFANKHPLVLYEILAILITLILVLPLIIQRYTGLGFVLRFHHYLGALGPISAALIVSSLRGELPKYFTVLTKLKISIVWYLAAVFVPAILFLTALIVKYKTGTYPAFTGFNTFSDFGTIGIPLAFVIHTVTYGIGEESGWRGFALRHLLKKNTLLKSTLIVTLMWLVWHTPMFFYRSGYMEMGLFGVLGWAFSLLMGAYILSWLFKKTESVIIPVLFHGAMNTFFTMQAAQGDVTLIFGALLMAVAGALFVFDLLQ